MASPSLFSRLHDPSSLSLSSYSKFSNPLTILTIPHSSPSSTSLSLRHWAAQDRTQHSRRGVTGAAQRGNRVPARRSRGHEVQATTGHQVPSSPGPCPNRRQEARRPSPAPADYKTNGTLQWKWKNNKKRLLHTEILRDFT